MTQKERGIIFTAWSIPKVLDGTKTQTRRTWGLEFVNQDPDAYEFLRMEGDLAVFKLALPPKPINYSGRSVPPRSHPRVERVGTRVLFYIKCPYGQVGGRLYIKETWRIESFMEGEPLLFGYKDGQTMEENEYGDTPTYESWYERICVQSTEDAKKAFSKGLVQRDDDGDTYRWDIGKSPCRWRSPRFMPRRASRIDLEITDLRAERLQGIGQVDIKKEGITMVTMQPDELWTSHIMANRWHFEELWDFVNPRYPWVGNHWVWPISFKEVI